MNADWKKMKKDVALYQLSVILLIMTDEQGPPKRQAKEDTKMFKFTPIESAREFASHGQGNWIVREVE
jgi:hypothetical protein